jgi:hypothetical protein
MVSFPTKSSRRDAIAPDSYEALTLQLARGQLLQDAKINLAPYGLALALDIHTLANQGTDVTAKSSVNNTSMQKAITPDDRPETTSEAGNNEMYVYYIVMTYCVSTILV